MSENTITAEVEIIAQMSSNKAGKPMGADLYLKHGSSSYYIKQMSCPADVLPMLKLGKINATYEIKNGLWDTDNPEVQSRIGEYVVVYKVKDIE